MFPLLAARGVSTKLSARPATPSCGSSFAIL
jgi:hypothetical protein